LKHFCQGLKKFNQTYGRTSKLDFWMFIMIYFIIYLILIFFEILYLDAEGVTYLYNFFMIIPLISIQVRRLHDVNKSGKLLFANLLPVIGQIYLFFLFIKEGDKYLNKYDYGLMENKFVTSENNDSTIDRELDKTQIDKISKEKTQKQYIEISNENIPKADSSWEEISDYASSFNCYEYWGSKNKFFEIVDEMEEQYYREGDLPNSPDKLRTLLFYLQRRIKFNSNKDKPSDVEWQLIEDIINNLNQNILITEDKYEKNYK